MKRIMVNKLNKFKAIIFSMSLIAVIATGLIVKTSGIFADAIPDKTDPVTNDTVLYTSSNRTYTIGDNDCEKCIDISKNGDNSMILAYFKESDTPLRYTAILYGVGELKNYYSIPDNDYKYCYNAKKLYVGKFKPYGIADRYFSNFNNVDEVDISGLDTSETTSMGYMFYGFCQGESFYQGENPNSDIDIDLSHLDIRKCNNFENCFACFLRYRKNVNMTFGEKFTMDVASNINAKDMFSYAGQYADNVSIIFPETCHFTNVNSAEQMFYYVAYESSGDVTIKFGSDADFSNATTMKYMFYDVAYNSRGNVLIDLGDNFNAYNVLNMERMFFYICGNSSNYANTATLDLGANFNTHLVNDKKVSSVENTNEMFYGTMYTTNSSSINFGEGYDFSNVTECRSMFSQMFNIANENITIYLPNGLKIGSQTYYQYNYFAENVYYYGKGDIKLIIGDPEDNEDGHVALDLTNIVYLFNNTGKNANSLEIEINGDVILNENTKQFMYNCCTNRTILNINGNVYINGNIDMFCREYSKNFKVNMTGKIYLNSSSYTINQFFYSKNMVDKLEFKFNDDFFTKINGMTDIFNEGVQIRECDWFKDKELSTTYTNGTSLKGIIYKMYIHDSGCDIGLEKIMNYDWYYYNDAGERLEQITDNKFSSKENAPVGASYIKCFANNQDALNIVYPDGKILTTADDVLKEIKFKYTFGTDSINKEVELVRGKDYTIKYADGVNPNIPGKRKIIFEGMDVYEGLNGEYECNVVAKNITVEDLSIEGYENGKLLTKYEDGTSSLPNNIKLIYLNPFNGDKIYFDYDSADFWLNNLTNLVSSASDSKLNVVFKNVRVSTTNGNKLDNYYYSSFPQASISLSNVGKILTKPSSGGSGGGSRSPKKEEPPVEVEENEPIKHVSYINGYDDGEFKPNRKVTRAEFAKIIASLNDEFSSNKYDEYKQYVHRYNDVRDNFWYTPYIGLVIKEEIMNGYPNGEFKPESNITRAEVCKVLVNVFDVNELNSIDSFEKEISGQWYFEPVDKLIKAGFINGYQDGTFKAERNITRAELVTLINRINKRTPNKDLLNNENISNKNGYKDIKEKDWFYLDVIEASNNYEEIKK